MSKNLSKSIVARTAPRIKRTFPASNGMKFYAEIRIGKYKLGKNRPVFIIAEAGVNHNGNLETALKLVDEAKKAGADAVKFQSFKAERLVSKGTPKVEHHKNSADPEESHFEMIRKLELSENDQKKIFDYCREKDILFLSTPYDVESAIFLNKLGVGAFKTASADIVDLPLHDFIASTGKPVIIAVGMATFNEIENVLKLYRKHKNPNVILLHCVSSYPAKKEGLNLRVISAIAKRFKTIVGYSDHSQGNTASCTAVALGGAVIEKHFTLDRKSPGPDHLTSESPEEFLNLVKAVRETETVLGSPEKSLQPEEKSMHRFSRKSLVASIFIPKGTKIKRNMLSLKRPGNGIPYSKIDSVIGKIAKEDIESDALIALSLFKKK